MPLAPLLLLLTTTQPAVPPSAAGQTIVVTGTRLSDTEKALNACLARHCPPAEDIRASLAHAENLFVAGRYRDAQAVTAAAVGRNKRYRKDLPVDVSDLYRANGRLAAHIGEAHEQEMSVGAMYGTLSTAFGNTDPRVLAADVERGDMYVLVGREELARHIYEETERHARAAGRADLAAIARVRAAWLFQQTGDIGFARQALEKIAADPSPQAKVGRLAAHVLLATLDRRAGKRQSTDALIEELRNAHMARPVLLYAPPLDLERAVRESGAPSFTRHMGRTALDGNWVDIGFWIGPDGKVHDVERLRGEGATGWTPTVLAAIQGRIYAPVDGPIGTYRVERYTYLTRWVEKFIVNMMARVPQPDIQTLDLTADPSPATKP